MTAEPEPVQKPRVLFLTRKWRPAVGGMETYSEQLVEHLEQTCQLETRVLPGRADGRPPSILSLLAFTIRCAFSLLRSKGQFEIVHGADMAIWPLVLVARLRSPRARLFLSAHGSDVSLAYRDGWAANAYRLYLGAAKRLLPGVKVIANSRATADLAVGLGFRQCHVTKLAAGCSADWRDARYPPKETSPNILFVGRLLGHKGCGWFIKHVLEELPSEIRLKVAGTGVDPSETTALDHPRVDYLGAVYGEALARARRAALAVIVPNIDTGMPGFEGFGLVATEAAGDGAVTLAADLHGLRDALIDGETGFLLPPGDPAAWRDKILDVAAWSPKQREDFVDRASRVTRDIYNWQRVASRTKALYAEAIGSRDRASENRIKLA